MIESGTTAVAQPQAFIAMEFVDGRTLIEYADEKGLEREARLHLLVQVADAVHHAHLRGVIHRDLKPSNILVTEDGRTKVIDFGVARVVDRDGDRTQQTMAGQLMGTLAYMSPEQIRGDIRAVDSRADTYALGVIAYELLSGRLPLDLSSVSLAEAIRRVAETEPEPLGRVAPKCRGDLEWIVARALEKDAAKRYQSTDALRQDIERYLADEPTEARPLTTVEKLGRIARRHKVAAAGIVSTLLAILIGAGVAIHYATINARLAGLEAAARENADDSAREALRLAELADKRASDVQTVSEFVRDQMGSIDPLVLGVRIREAMTEEVRRGLSESGLGDEAVEGELDALASLLERARTTTVATKTLDRVFFEPMRAAIDQRFANRPELYLKLLLAHGELLNGQSRLEPAAETFRTAIAVADALPDETVDGISARLLLGATLATLQRFDEAVPLLQDALNRSEGKLPPLDRRLTNALSGLAMAADARGDLERAEELFREQLARRNTSPDGSARDRREAVATMNNLGVLLQRTGRADESLALSERARQLVRPDAPDEAYIELTWRALRASSLTTLKRFEESLEEWERAIERARVAFGDQHVHTIGLYNGYTVALTFLGRFAETEDPMRNILEFHEKEYGATHFATANARVNLAFTKYAIGKLEEAELLGETALEQLKSTVGLEHERTQYTLRQLIRVYRGRAEQEPESGYDEKRAALERLLVR